MSWFEEDATPRYQDPPVVETAIGVQFPPVPGLSVVHLARLQDAWSDEYPALSERPGTFPQPALQENGAVLQFGFGPSPIRIWAEQAETGLLVQTQNDRLVLNWRAQMSSGPYPHYAVLRDEFLRLWDRYCAGVSQQGLGVPVPQTVEFTYVNNVPLPESESVADVMTFLTIPEGLLPGADVATRFQLIRQVTVPGSGAVAQLVVVGEPQFGPDGRSLQLTITTTVPASDGTDLSGATSAAHALAANTFAAVTSDGEQTRWGRQ